MAKKANHREKLEGTQGTGRHRKQAERDVLGRPPRSISPCRGASISVPERSSSLYPLSPTPKLINSPSIQSVTGPLLEVLQSSGATSASFHASIEHFRAALVELKVGQIAAKRAADQLMILGQEVHGPEGDRNMPLLRLRPVK